MNGLKSKIVCSTCIMDQSDPLITFDDNGSCSYCQYYRLNLARFWRPNEDGRVELERLVAVIKADGVGKKHDCIIGLSGGVDSSYLALMASRLGLRPLIVHVDAGWNSERAVRNIERIVKKLNLDLRTVIVDWQSMRRMQLAYLRASVPNQDIPQDHSLFAGLYSVAAKSGIRHVLTGSNYASESVLPTSWGYTASDTTQIRAIFAEFGEGGIGAYPLMSYLRFNLIYKKLRGMKVWDPLNLIPYDKEKVKIELADVLGWTDYGTKHGESRFTKFFQNYYLPTKFGFDKRRAHLASLVISGQLQRADALAAMEKPLYAEHELIADMIYIRKKLEISESEFSTLLNLENRSHGEFATDARIRVGLEKLTSGSLYGLLVKTRNLVKRAIGRTKIVLKIDGALSSHD